MDNPNINFANEIADLKNRLKKIEDAKINNETISAGDIIYLADRINALEKMASSAPARRKYPVLNNRKPAAAQAPKERKKLSETEIGKYGVGILASVLILLGVFTAVRIFWDVIPNALKLVFVVSAGLGVGIAGFINSKKTDLKNGFWTSVAATGDAVVFIGLASGAIAWRLYGAAVLGALLFIWFLISFIISSNLNSRVFYSVSYLGALVSVALALIQIDASGERSAVIGFAMLSVVMPAIGIISSKKNKLLPVLNYLFLCIVAFLCASKMGDWRIAEKYEPVRSFHPENFDVLLFTAVQFVASALALYQSQLFEIRHKAAKNIFKIIAGIIASVFMIITFVQPVPLFERSVLPGSISSLIIIMAFGAAGFVLFRKGIECDAYLNAIAPPAAAALSMMLSGNENISCVVPNAIAMCPLIYLFFKRNEGYVKTAIYLFYAASLIVLSGESRYGQPVLFLLTASIPMSAAGLGFYIASLANPLKYRYAEPAALSVFAFLPLRCLVGRIAPGVEVPGIFATMFITLHILYNKVANLIGKEDCREKRLTNIFIIITLAFIHLSIYLSTFSLFGSYECGAVEKALITLTLISMSAAAFYEAVMDKKMVYAVLAIISMNLNLMYISDLLADGNYVSLLVSVIGIFIASGFIACGFFIKRKGMRILGLVTMIIYVLKISVYDLAEAGAGGLSVLMLIAGGLICFAISFAYNKLDKFFGDENNIGKGEQ